MLKHYFIIGIRNVLKHLSISLATIIGYALTLSMIFPVFLLVFERTLFDNFQDQNIYRVTTKLEQEGIEFATSPKPLGEYIAANLPGVEMVSYINFEELKISAGTENSAMMFRSGIVDSHFFSTFKFESRISLATVNHNSIILTAESARRLFGSEDVVGQVVSIEKYGDWQVGAVLDDSPRTSHLDFELYLFASSFYKSGDSNEYQDWDDFQSSFTYLVSDNDQERLAGDLILLSEKLSHEQRFDVKMMFDLQRLSEIATDQLYGDTMAIRKIQNPLLYMFCGALLFTLATINYFSLFVTRTITRMREAGMRKIFGVTNLHIWIQYSIESFIVLIVASFFGIIVMLLLPIAELQVALAKSGLPPELWLWYFAFIVILSLVTAGVPLIIISRLDLIVALKAPFSNLRVKGVNLQKGLLLLQLCCTLVVTTILLVVISQSNYATTANYGFQSESIWAVELQGANNDLVYNKVGAQSNVELVSLTSDFFGRMPGKIAVRKALDSANSFFFDYFVERPFIDMFRLQIIAGTNISEDVSRRQMIINEAAVRELGYKHPIDAVGEMVVVNDTLSVRVIGVVKDFHFDNFKRSIRPLVLHNIGSDHNWLLFKVNKSTTVDQVRSQIDSIWMVASLNTHPKIVNYSDEFKTKQSHSEDVRVLSIIVFYILAITFLSLFGITTHNMKLAAKSICLRKIFGASNRGAAFLLSKLYLKICGISMLISLPTAYFVSGLFLKNFAYKIELSLDLFTWPTLLVFVFTLSIVWLQAMLYAAVNPAKTLRYE